MVDKKTTCLNFVENFNNEGSVQYKQQYAECIYTLYPLHEPPTETKVLLVKIVIILMIIGALVGYKIASCGYWHGDRVFGFLVGFVTPPMLAMAAMVVYLVLRFLIS